MLAEVGVQWRPSLRHFEVIESLQLLLDYPLDYIARFGNLITAIHVKDIAPMGENLDEDGWSDLGAGTLDWTAYLRACRAHSSDLIYALEHDKPSDPIGYASRSSAVFKNLWEATND